MQICPLLTQRKDLAEIAFISVMSFSTSVLFHEKIFQISTANEITEWQERGRSHLSHKDTGRSKEDERVKGQVRRIN